MGLSLFDPIYNRISEVLGEVLSVPFNAWKEYPGSRGRMRFEWVDDRACTLSVVCTHEAMWTYNTDVDIMISADGVTQSSDYLLLRPLPTFSLAGQEELGKRVRRAIRSVQDHLEINEAPVGAESA